MQQEDQKEGSSSHKKYPEESLIAPTLNVQVLSEKLNAENIFSKYIPGEGFTSKYDPHSEFLAIGCNNGMKILFSNKEKKIVETVECPDQTPVTSVRWRPNCDQSKSPVLGAGNSEGIFEYYHIPSMKKLFSVAEKDNSIHTIDFSPSGEQFATAGKDCSIRVYDENTKSIATTFGGAEWNQTGHSNRIFSVKFVDENVLVSGGWDSVIHQWDLRVGKSVRSVHGPHVAGDSIDFKNGELLVGNYAVKHQIQIWDFASFKPKQQISWSSVEDKEKVAYVYSSCFSPKGDAIIAGSCGVNEVKLFSRQNDSFKEGVRVHGLKNGCFSVDHCKIRNEFCFTTAHEGFYAYKYARK